MKAILHLMFAWIFCLCNSSETFAVAAVTTLPSQSTACASTFSDDSFSSKALARQFKIQKPLADWLLGESDYAANVAQLARIYTEVEKTPGDFYEYLVRGLKEEWTHRPDSDDAILAILDQRTLLSDWIVQERYLAARAQLVKKAEAFVQSRKNDFNISSDTADYFLSAVSRYDFSHRFPLIDQSSYVKYQTDLNLMKLALTDFFKSQQLSIGAMASFLKNLLLIYPRYTDAVYKNSYSQLQVMYSRDKRGTSIKPDLDAPTASKVELLLRFFDTPGQNLERNLSRVLIDILRSNIPVDVARNIWEWERELPNLLQYMSHGNQTVAAILPALVSAYSHHKWQQEKPSPKQIREDVMNALFKRVNEYAQLAEEDRALAEDESQKMEANPSLGIDSKIVDAQNDDMSTLDPPDKPFGYATTDQSINPDVPSTDKPGHESKTEQILSYNPKTISFEDAAKIVTRYSVSPQAAKEVLSVMAKKDIYKRRVMKQLKNLVNQHGKSEHAGLKTLRHFVGKRLTEIKSLKSFRVIIIIENENVVLSAAGNAKNGAASSSHAQKDLIGIALKRYNPPKAQKKRKSA